MSLDPKKVWLNRLLLVDRKYNAEVTKALAIAAEDIQEAVHELYAKPGIGYEVRRAQLTGVSGVISLGLRTLFRGTTSDIIHRGNAEAATEAIKANNIWDDEVLRKIIPDGGTRKAFKYSLESSASKNIDATVTRITKSKIPLSRRIYRAEAISRGQIDRIVNSGLAKGDGADEIAKKAKDFISPRVPGGAAYSARRLARTEINNAFHSQSIAAISERPWIAEANWRLSGSHTPKIGDKCEHYARVGRYPVSSIPLKPHPNCLCYITPVVPEIDFILSQFYNGMYDQWLRDNEALSAA